ncbi:phosphodiesterase [Andreprevotia chitinilytica]|uniref:phosphodiesterase n=1 Tax=Andreprevotia chitinilytica TaxID=396808 RepID=UPI00055096B5|nr:phosphodiesterase [Andreprevotia chitinilytica]
MILAQITDLHIKAGGRKAYGRVDTAAALARCIDRLNTLEPRPDAVLVTGDLVDAGGADEYATLKPLLDQLAMPYYLAVGNHDHRENLLAAFPEHAYLAQHPGFIQYRVDLGPLRIIALDTQHPPHSDGQLCAARLDWLQAQLAACAGRPTLILMHHPPFQTGIDHMDAIGLDPASTAALAGLVAAHPNVEQILCGHLHRPITTRFAGTLASTAPSTAHQVALDLRPDGPSAFVLEPGGYVLHQWRPGQGLVSHVAQVDAAEGPYPFHDAAGVLLD